MEKAKLRKLVELIDEIARSPEGSYSERREAVMAEASEDEKGSIEEFASWFMPGG